MTYQSCMWQWNFRVKNADVCRTEQTDALVASGALDDVFAKMDAGQPFDRRIEPC